MIVFYAVFVVSHVIPPLTINKAIQQITMRLSALGRGSVDLLDGGVNRTENIRLK